MLVVLYLLFFLLLILSLLECFAVEMFEVEQAVHHWKIGSNASVVQQHTLRCTAIDLQSLNVLATDVTGSLRMRLKGKRQWLLDLF